MTIRKGGAWGEARPLPDDGVVVRSDAEARAVVLEARRRGGPVPAIGLLGGDLCRTLGGRGDAGRLRSADAMSFPVDLGTALVDGRLQVFVAHLVARNPLSTKAFVAMNAQWLDAGRAGVLNAAPRGHPNDGLLDCFDVGVPLTGTWPVLVRARTGSHLPHPGIGERRVAAMQVRFDRPRRVLVDGVDAGRARDLSVRVDADALTVVV